MKNPQAPVPQNQWLVALVCLFGMLLTPPATAATPKEKFHLYILAGQSNMEGLGGWAVPRHLEPMPRTLILTRPANGKSPLPDPLWVPLGQNYRLGDRGVGPEWGFARALAAQEPPDVTIGIIKIPVSGSNIECWINDKSLPKNQGEFYATAIETIQRAMQDGVLKGFLWHQGESNSNTKDYDLLLERMVKEYREALGLPDLPVVVGTIGEDGDKKTSVNLTLLKAAARIPHFQIVSSRRTLSDNVHFDADSQDEMGRLYASAILTSQGRPQPLTIASSALPDGTAGTWYVRDLTTTGGDGTMVNFSCANLPAGLTLKQNTIEGRLPEQACELALEFTAKDGSGVTTATLPLRVKEATAKGLAIIPTTDFCINSKAFLPNNRVLYVGGGSKATKTTNFNAYLIFDVPEAFRSSASARLRFFVESAGKELPAKLLIKIMENTGSVSDTIDFKDAATYPKAGEIVAELTLDKPSAAYELALSNDVWQRGLQEGRIGFVLSMPDSNQSSPVIITSNRGDQKPELILESGPAK